MKAVFMLEWDDDMGKCWMNIFNLELCLFSKEHTKEELLKVTELKEGHQKAISIGIMK